MDAAALERILRPSNATITAERAALKSGRWAAYLRERVPPPSRLDFRRRRAWEAAYERALQLGQRSAIRTAVVVPVWYCNNEDDVPVRRWSRAGAVGYHEDSTELHEQASLEGIVVETQLEEARIGFIMPGRYYAPGSDVAYRNEHYVAVESPRIERVIAIERIVNVTQLPQPVRETPAFTVDAEAAVAFDSLDSALADRARRTIEKLRVTPRENAS